jgi:hypothetical protein
MKKTAILIGFVLLISAFGCQTDNKIHRISSPDNRLTLNLQVNKQGIPQYSLMRDQELVVLESNLAFELNNEADFLNNWEITHTETSDFSETWEMPWGEKRTVKNEYRELFAQLSKKNNPERKLNLRFRLYNDGLGFRYEFPEQVGLDSVIISEEKTEFKLRGDHKCFWQPGDWDIYEHLYNTTKFSEIDALQFRAHDNLAQTHIPNNAVNTPVTMKSSEGYYMSFHEAALTDYAGMTLKVDTAALRMESCLVGSENTDYKVARKLPFHTPWRTVQVSDNAAGLIESDLIVNLNEPNKIGNVSWFTPMKYVGIWWEMHLGKSTWDYSSTQDMNTYTGGKPHGKHGATTENAKRYIDFAAENNIGGVLIEGWNTGWENWIGTDDREGIFDFVTSYPDYDLKEVTEYAKSKGVEIIMHHETSAAVKTYEQQLDTAFKLMNKLGIHSVKTGYVGKILPPGEYHHGQYMVRHYRKVLKKAAEYHIAVNAHEPIKATGIRRTYPNAISREGLRGQEFNAWASDGGNPPEHLTIVPFTRMLGGPVDFTPGIFNIKLDPYKKDNQINTTLAHQLALYVVIYSPVQMAADLPENYENHPAFQFIRDVPANWEETRVIDGEIGDFVCIARQERNSSNWFLGAVTDENERELSIDLDFLEADKTYTAIIYRDAENAHWDDNPRAYEIEEKSVTANDTLKLLLKPGGGAAVSFKLDVPKE